MKAMLAQWIWLPVVFAVYVSGCVDVNDTSLTPNPTAETLLSGFLARAEDFPPDWKLEERRPTDDRILLCGAATKAFAQDTLSGQATVFYAGRQNQLQIANSVLASRRGQASRSMAIVRKAFLNCPQWEDTSPEGSVVLWEQAPFEFPNLGDETIAVKATARVQGSAFHAYFVAVRKGDICLLMVVLQQDVDDLTASIRDATTAVVGRLRPTSDKEQDER